MGFHTEYANATPESMYCSRETTSPRGVDEFEVVGMKLLRGVEVVGEQSPETLDRHRQDDHPGCEPWQEPRRITLGVEDRDLRCERDLGGHRQLRQHLHQPPFGN
jgi:hypothetical protein